MNASVINFFRAMRDGKVVFDLCDVSKAKGFLLKSIEMQKKSSSSPSENAFTAIALSALGNKRFPIALKIFQDEKNPDILGLKYEMKIYQRIIEKIILKNQSPNFVGYVASGCCRESTGLYRDLANFLNYKNYCILATEKVGNGTYFNFPRDLPVNTLLSVYSKMNYIDRLTTMFQLCYSLELAQRYRIVHNDFHAENVLVMTLPSAISMGFIIDGQKYRMTTRYIPYIFDWDLAYCEVFGENPKIETEFYSSLNIYNKFNKKTDFYTLLCTLKTSLPDFMSKMETQGISVQITEKTVENIKKFRPLFKSVEGKSIYRFGKGQLETFFGPEFNVLNYSSFFIEKRGSYYYAVFYKGFSCRPSTMHKEMLTPLEYIKRKCTLLETLTLDNINYKFIYTMPTEEKSKRIFIDPLLSRRGRETLRDLGIKPKFLPQKTGYVKIRNN